MLGVAVFGAVLAVDLLADRWLTGREMSGESGCLLRLVPVALPIAGAVVVYRVGSSNYDDPDALTRTGLILVAQAATMAATVFWLRFVERSDWLTEPSPYRSGWTARFESPMHIMAPAFAWLALVIAVVGVLSTLAGAAGGDAAAACFIALVMVVWAGAHFS